MSAAKGAIQLDYSSRSSFFKTLSGHYDALCEHFPEELVLTPQYPTPKKFKGYLYQQKVLLRLEAPHLPRSQYQGLGKRSAHEVGLVVPSWKYRKVGLSRSCDFRHAVEANLSSGWLKDYVVCGRSEDVF
jgi:hypothetical protein